MVTTEILTLDKGLLTREGEVYLVGLIREGGPDAAWALEEMFDANMGIVYAVAKKFSNQHFTTEDLLQEGRIGLIRAIEKFDFSKGFKFATYAYWWVRQAIGRSIQEQGHTIRLPVHVSEVLSKVRAVTRILYRQLGRQPSYEEISDVLEIPRARMARIMEIANEPLSLQQGPAYEESEGRADGSLERTIPSENLVETFEDAEANVRVRRILRTISPREEVVLRMRFGLD